MCTREYGKINERLICDNLLLLRRVRELAAGKMECTPGHARVLPFSFVVSGPLQCVWPIRGVSSTVVRTAINVQQAIVAVYCILIVSLVLVLRDGIMY